MSNEATRGEIEGVVYHNPPQPKHHRLINAICACEDPDRPGYARVHKIVFGEPWATCGACKTKPVLV